MKDLASYIRLFRETSPFIGSLSKVQAGIRSALRVFANEYQLDDSATDSVTLALKKNMRSAVIAIALLTSGLKTLVDFNTFLAGGTDVPKHIMEALLKHHALSAELSSDYPEGLKDKYCGQMIWRVADSLMKGSLRDLCSAALADKE